MTTEPRNLILCSDGTGNAGGKQRGTNVWRIYQAVERDVVKAPNGQFVFYEDGVGTDSFKLFKVIGGAFGWGISRNLEKLYAYLLRQFEPTDKIYLFGFSRGAFTVRTLANILYECGIADSADRSPEKLDEIAQKAVAAYKKRHTSKDATKEFRLKYGLKHSDPDKQGEEFIGRFPIHFIGVWDTVDAVGLPFQGLTQAFLWMPFFSLNLKETGQSWRNREDDLNPLVRNAYHAVAIDDHRFTFQPLLWIEHSKDGRHKTDPESEDARINYLDGTGRNVEQVWFAGVHANVGGGYPKDQLALVSLTWMMQHAERAGLHLKETLRDEIERDHDVHGLMYNSRSGLKSYYRYRPRDMKELSDECGIKDIKIHETVFERIKEQTQDYAPSGVPRLADYQVVSNPILTHTKAGRRRVKRKIGDESIVNEPKEIDNKRWIVQEFTRDFIWWRRVLYVMFLLWSAGTLIVGIIFVKPKIAIPENPWLYEPHFWGIAGLTFVFSTIIALAGKLFIGQTFKADVREKADLALDQAAAGDQPDGPSNMHELPHHARLIKRLRQVVDVTSLVRNLAFLSIVLVFLQNYFVDRVSHLLPGSIGLVVGSIASNSVLLLSIGLSGYLIFNRWRYSRSNIRDISVAAWKTGLRMHEGQTPKDFCLGTTSSFGLLELARHFRTHSRVDRLSRIFDRYISPVLALCVVVFFMLGFVIGEVSQQVFEYKMDQAKHPISELEPITTVVTTIDSSSIVRATNLLIEEGRRYHIHLEPYDSTRNGDPDTESDPSMTAGWNWTDDDRAATPDGILNPPWWVTLEFPLKRHMDQPWFKVMAAIGPNHDFVIPIGKDAVFVAPHSGELMLYVNDALWSYDQNDGRAKVTIVCVDETLLSNVKQAPSPSDGPEASNSK
jgi:uncharacterized protein (DUF2235 family)